MQNIPPMKEVYSRNEWRFVNPQDMAGDEKAISTG
jgi:hypothetical protein